MIGRIGEILKLTDDEDFLKAQKQFDDDLEEATEVLQSLLDKNILSTDVTDTQMHMAAVECYRARVCKWHAFAVAFSEHGASSVFLPAKKKGEISEADRQSHLKHLAAGSKAHVAMLDGFIRCIDSRVNACKKVLGIEGDGNNYGKKYVS